MLTQDKTGLLKAFLGGLPGHVAARLARAVEMDRLMDGKALPHADILTGLRPVLSRDHNERSWTPLRLFCLPFQDVLSSSPRKAKLKAVVTRDSVMPVWNWLSTTLVPAEARAYVAETKALILAQKNDDVLARAQVFWTLAAPMLTAALVDEKAAKTALGGEMTVADAHEMALLLGAGQAVLQVQTLMPLPTPGLNETLLWELRAIYDQLVVDRVDIAPYVAVIAMNRLSRPWEALKLPLSIARQTHDALISKTDMGLVGEILFTRLDDLQAALQTTRHPLFNADTLLEQARSFAELSSAIVKEIEVRRDGEWGQRLLKDRAKVGAVMDGFMDRAPKEIANALPMQKGTGKSADFTRAADAEKRELAVRYARLVVGSRNFAAAASFAAKQKEAFGDMCTYLRRYNEDVVREMRVTDPQKRTVVESQFELAAELTALLFSPEEAELLRRRGKAAQAAAA